MSNKRKEMLALPGIFLPHNKTITILSYKLLRMLDFDIDVLAMKTQNDNSLKENIECDPMYKKFTIFYAGEYRYALFERSNKNIIKMFINNRKYVKEAVTKSISKQYDIVFSLSIPNFSHMAGYQVKRKNKNIKWIASFSDPIIGNPMHDYMKKEYKSLVLKLGHFLVKTLNDNGIYQKKAFKYADTLVFVSAEQRDFMTKGNTKLVEKSIIVPFTYIKQWPIYQKVIDEQSTPMNKPKRITHLGNVYGARRIDSLIEGIKIAKQKIPDLHEHIIIEHYGNMEKRQQDLIIKNNIEDVLFTYERIPYAQTLEIMNKSDVLLMLDVYISEKDLQPFMPSKFIEYFLTNKLILSIANKKSPIYRHLKTTEHITVKPNGEDIAQALIDIIDKSCFVKNNYEVYENETVMNNTLLKLIDERV